LRLSSFGGYGLALAALALVVFGACDSYPFNTIFKLIEYFGGKAEFSISCKKFNLYRLADKSDCGMLLNA